MALTAATTTELSLPVARAGYWKVEMRSFNTGSTAWLEFQILDKAPAISWVRGQARQCTFRIAWASAYNSETTLTNYLRLRSEVRATAVVTTASGDEQVVKFLGIVINIAVDPTGKVGTVTCADYSILANECECSVQVSPTEAQLDITRPRLYLVAGGIYGRAFGLSYADVPDAFNTVGTPGTKRRAWVPGSPLRIYSHPTLSDSKYIIPFDHYKVYQESGVVEIIEPKHLINSYTATDEVKIPGDHSAFFVNGVQFDIVDSTNNDGTWTVDSSTYNGAGYTIITVTSATLNTAVSDGTVFRNYYYGENIRVYLETGGTALGGTVTGADCDIYLLFKQALEYAKASGGIGATASDHTLASLGYDLSMAYNFEGRVADLFKKITDDFQANLQLRFDPTLVQSGTYPTWVTGKWRVDFVVQAGSATWSLLEPKAIGISRERADQDVYTRVVVEGDTEQPENSAINAVASDISGLPDWFAWDGLEVGSDDTFANVYPNVHNGNDALGASVHNLGDPDYDIGGTAPGPVGEKYNGWYNFVQYDYGSAQDPVGRVRFVMPPTRNVKAQAGDQRIYTGGDAVGFWPGVWIQVSDDATTWLTLSPVFYGNYPPGHVLEADTDQIFKPRFRYLRILCMAYKHGFDNQSDPSIGCGEFSTYHDLKYKVVKEISASAGNYYYTSDLSQATPYSYQYADLLSRFNSRQKTWFEKADGRFNEYLAHDYALNLWREKLRLFESPRWQGSSDPRIEPFDTITVVDSQVGDVTCLVTELQWGGDLATVVSATNFAASVLGN